MLVKVYAKIWAFIVTCVLCFGQIHQYIAILELPNCLSYGWLTFLKRWYWLVGQEYNKHVTMKDLISA